MMVCGACRQAPEYQLPSPWPPVGGGGGGGPGGVGPQGPPGPGVAPGGTTGQILAKTSNANFATEWIDQPSPDFEEGTQETTERWIDGRIIMRYTLQAHTGTPLNQINNLSALPSFDQVVRFDGYCEAQDGYSVPVGFNSGGSSYFSAQIRNNGMITETHGDSRFSNRPIVIVVYYVQSGGARRRK